MNQENNTDSNTRRFSEYFYNAITYLGVFISILVLSVEAFLFAIDFFADNPNTYLQLITYLILPAFLIFGLFLIPVGVLWKRRRLSQGKPRFEMRSFRIDLALPHHRNFLLVFIAGTAVFVLMSLVGSYRAYHYTESVQFCGTLCHSVMHPEYTAYTNSPHGKVKCVECHIGSGASWYVKSKASGLRQIYKTALGTYTKPITVPVENLRPAEDTCKQCHWPGKYFSTMDFKRSYFLTQGENPRWNLRMFLNVGGGGSQSYGIHAHMNLDRELYYAADDEKRQKISWVKSVAPDGTETVYVTAKSPWKDQAPEPQQIRKMDCIDCHNRPTHLFRSPDQLINMAMQFGEIGEEIPGIKSVALQSMVAEYRDENEAAEGIRSRITDFYKSSHSDYYASNADKVEVAILKVQDLYSKNIFPRMKVRWDRFPDNIGHMVSPGCFRCHDGKHRSSDGKKISRDCKSCHLIVEQGPAGQEEKNIDGLEFKHPDGGEDWMTMACTDCHTGGADF